jgi:circadian clock protein KaiB
MEEKEQNPSADNQSSIEELEQALEDTKHVQYTLRLYVTGITPRSQRAIENIRKICEESLKGRYDLEVIDIYQQPERAREEQIIAAPTLIKKLPLPLRKLIGDMSNRDRILIGLGLEPKD